jgi:hypothetical protein
MKQDNSVISSKSDEVSIDAIEISMKKFDRKNNNFDVSSIEKVLFDDGEEVQSNSEK